MRSKHIGNLSNYKYFVHKLGENVFVIVCTMSKTFHVCFLLMASNRLLDLLQVALQRANQMSRGGMCHPRPPPLTSPCQRPLCPSWKKSLSLTEGRYKPTGKILSALFCFQNQVPSSQTMPGV